MKTLEKTPGAPAGRRPTQCPDRPASEAAFPCHGWPGLLPAWLSLIALWVPSSFAWGEEDWFDSLRYRSQEGALELRLGGKFHYDLAQIDAEGEDPRFKSAWRRARLSISARLFEDWRFRYEYDFAASQDWQIKDAWVGYYGFDKTRIRAGHIQVPQSLEELTSSNALTFMERALPNALVEGYRMGLRADRRGDGWTLAGGVFEGPIRGREVGMDQGWRIAGRATMSPYRPKWGRLHLGISAEYRDLPGHRSTSYDSRPELRLTDTKLVSTGTLSDVDYTFTDGVEFAVKRGSLSVQGEYLRADVLRTGREDVNFAGWYLFGSWFLFGGERPYDKNSGVFASVEPEGRYGALEAAVRHSELDLQDGPITGGHKDTWTVGLNWYLNRRARIMGNWVHARADPNRDGNPEDHGSYQVRLQLAF